jgi:hypothetical protein
MAELTMRRVCSQLQVYEFRDFDIILYHAYGFLGAYQNWIRRSKDLFNIIATSGKVTRLEFLSWIDKYVAVPPPQC